jgi:coproporphyrinogen III oxidase
MIDEIERIDGSGQVFSRDGWGAFSESSPSDNTDSSGGITRVLQGGNVVEKGACSLTVIRNGKLTKERAETISGRQQEQGVNDDAVTVQEGDVYSAAALSVVLHTRNPFVPVSRCRASGSSLMSVEFYGCGRLVFPTPSLNQHVTFFFISTNIQDISIGCADIPRKMLLRQRSIGMVRRRLRSHTLLPN